MNQIKKDKKIILFCFTYAGGSATVYNKFKPYLNKNIILKPIEYAGRGKRIREDFYADVASAVNDIYEQIAKYIDEYEFAIFGHSMGTVVAYEVCKKIRKISGKEPLYIFVSGRYPPHIKKKGDIIYNLPDDEFKRAILKIGGTPKEVFENKDLAALFLPIIRADYKIIELYDFNGAPVKFKSRIAALGGKDDKIVTENELFEWQKYSEHEINVYQFDGGHFYINSYIKEIADIINKSLIKEEA